MVFHKNTAFGVSIFSLLEKMLYYEKFYCRIYNISLSQAISPLLIISHFTFYCSVFSNLPLTFAKKSKRLLAFRKVRRTVRLFRYRRCRTASKVSQESKSEKFRRYCRRSSNCHSSNYRCGSYHGSLLRIRAHSIFHLP